MTVCIAAIFESGTPKAGIAIVADRQFTDTETDLKHTSPYPKIFALTKSIVALVADDMALQSELIYKTQKAIAERRNLPPLTVKQAVGLYQTAHQEKLEEFFQNNHLARYALTYKDLHTGNVSEHLVDAALDELRNATLPYGIQTIIAGVDGDGPQISVIEINQERNDETTQTGQGYAAIGSGRNIAEDQFKLAGFEKEWNAVPVSFMALVAKKRAERIASVGEETDMRLILQSKVIGLTEPVQANLEKDYKQLERQIRRYEVTMRKKHNTIEYIIKNPNNGGESSQHDAEPNDAPRV